MTESEIFYRLFSGGKHSLPWLIKLSHPDAGTIRLVNNNEAVQLDDETYEVANFEYVAPDTSGEGGQLKIAAADNGIIQFVEQADSRWRLDVVGVIAHEGVIQRIKQYTHFFGSISYGVDMIVEFQLGRDDRLDMKFPPYMFDTDNNRGNT